MIAIELPPDVETRLRSLAERTGRTETDWAKEAIARFVDCEERATVESAYEHMAANKSREAEALEWSEGLAGDGS